MPRQGNPQDQVRGTNWSVTYWFDTENTPSKEKVDEYIARARQRGWVINGQIEKAPETGNLHYQLHLNTRKQVRASDIKKMLPTAWIQKARKTVALQQYVVKEDTRVAPLADETDKYPTANKLWELIYREYDIWDKEGWDQTEWSSGGEVQLYREDDQKALQRDPLAFFDKVMGQLIRKGYYVDMLASNPAIRSFWKKFWADILYRTREVVRQTDRQNELISDAVNIPTYNAENGSSDREEDDTGGRDSRSPGSQGDEESASGTDEGRDESSSDETDADDDWQGS